MDDTAGRLGEDKQSVDATRENEADNITISKEVESLIRRENEW